MLMCSCRPIRLLCVFLLGAGASIQVDASPEVPPPEFWDYMNEFDSESGELVDPFELAQVFALQKSEKAAIKNESDAPINIGVFSSAAKKVSDQHSSTNLSPKVPEGQLK